MWLFFKNKYQMYFKFTASYFERVVFRRNRCYLTETDVIWPKQFVLAGMAERASEAGTVLAK